MTNNTVPSHYSILVDWSCESGTSKLALKIWLPDTLHGEVTSGHTRPRWRWIMVGKRCRCRQTGQVTNFISLYFYEPILAWWVSEWSLSSQRFYMGFYLKYVVRHRTRTLWCQCQDTVLLISTLLLFDPVLFPKHEAWLLIGSIPNFEALLGAPLIKTT